MDIIYQCKQFIFSSHLWNRLPFGKNQRELGYWKDNIARMEKWYSGLGKYNFPYPNEEQKIKSYDHTTNAILTYINSFIKNGSYLRDLQLDRNHFKDKIVADIGSGPMPTLLMFDNCCKRYCIDHLMQKYKEIGYPHYFYKESITFINSKSEKLDLESNSIDAVVSVNALDHVDNFKKTADEIKRILIKGGELHLLINLHPSKTSTETQSLTREDVLNCFDEINNFHIIKVNKKAYGFNDGETVLFSNITR